MANQKELYVQQRQLRSRNRYRRTIFGTVVDGNVTNKEIGSTVFATIASGGFVSVTDLTFQVDGILFSGNAQGTFITAPEPSELDGLLLGTGILAFAEMTRRKLRLGT